MAQAKKPAAGQPQGAKDRREAAREEARQRRQAQLRRENRVRVISIAAVIGAVAIIALVVGLVVFNGGKAGQVDLGGIKTPKGSVGTTLPITGSSTKDAARVDVYLDYMCPYCNQFEESSGSALEKQVEAGNAVVYYHVRNFLDGSSQTKYSTRAGNAAACVYNDNPKNFVPYTRLLYANQPEEQSAGLTDAKLGELATQAGASSSVASCLKDGTYNKFINAVDQQAIADGYTGTPVVLVNGKALDNDAYDPTVLVKKIKAGKGKGDIELNN